MVVSQHKRTPNKLPLSLGNPYKGPKMTLALLLRIVPGQFAETSTSPLGPTVGLRCFLLWGLWGLNN